MRLEKKCSSASAFSATPRPCGRTTGRTAEAGKACSTAWSGAAPSGRKTKEGPCPTASPPYTGGRRRHRNKGAVWGGTMRELVARYLSRSISRRGFLKGLTTAGISLASAESILESLVPIAHAQGTPRIAPEAIKMVEGTGAECFAEQLIASGVKYVFGNSASEDAQFYEALVDRPQLKYILTPHEGPAATASRRWRTRKASSRRSPSTRGSRAAPT